MAAILNCIRVHARLLFTVLIVDFLAKLFLLGSICVDHLSFPPLNLGLKDNSC